jgi:hypothetical protein
MSTADTLPFHCRSAFWTIMDFPAHGPTSSEGGLMIKVTIMAGLLILTTPATAQEIPPMTWRDPDTRCVYLKVGDTLSLRYRRDGTPDCASVQQDSTDASITRGDLRDLTQQITRSLEDLRRDIGAVRREMERTCSELENIRRETRQPRAQ